jgi:hypothetical protein
MTSTSAPGSGDPLYVDPDARGAAYGLGAFAGVLLAAFASMQLLEGIAAVSTGNLYADDDTYSYALDVTTWGWIHVVLGVLGVLVGVGIVARQAFGQLGGIVIAILAAVANFAFLPYFPVWSLVLLGLDALVIWALTTQLRDDSSGHPPDGGGRRDAKVRPFRVNPRPQ